MDEDAIIEQLKDTLTRLEKATTSGSVVAGISTAAAITAKTQVNLPIDLGIIKVPVTTAGFVAFFIFFVIVIRIFRSLSWIETSFKSLTNESKKKARWVIRNHLWLFNPFYETKGRFHFISDNLGLFLMIVLWWFGAYSGITLLITTGQVSGITTVVTDIVLTPTLWPVGLLLSLYGLVGAVTLRIIWKMVKEFSIDDQSANIKIHLNNLGALVGCFGVGLIYYFLGAFR